MKEVMKPPAHRHIPHRSVCPRAPLRLIFFPPCSCAADHRPTPSHFVVVACAPSSFVGGRCPSHSKTYPCHPLRRCRAFEYRRSGSGHQENRTRSAPSSCAARLPVPSSCAAPRLLFQSSCAAGECPCGEDLAWRPVNGDPRSVRLTAGTACVSRAPHRAHHAETRNCLGQRPISRLCFVELASFRLSAVSDVRLIDLPQL